MKRAKRSINSFQLMALSKSRKCLILFGLRHFDVP